MNRRLVVDSRAIDSDLSKAILPSVHCALRFEVIVVLVKSAEREHREHIHF